MSYDNMHSGSDSYPNQTQWKIKVESLLADVNIFTPHVGKKFPLGARAESRDGRIWRYQQNGAGILPKANGAQSAVETANWVDEVQTNNTDIPIVGAKLINVVMQTTAVIDQFVDSYLWVEQGTGEGDMYLVKNNKAGTTNSSGGFDVVFEIADTGGLRTVYATTSNISILLNPYRDVIIFPTDPTGICTGICHTAVPVEYYFWGQVHGPCVVMNGTDDIVTGDNVTIGAQAEGVLSLEDGAAPNEGDVVVGYVMRGTTQDNEAALVFLTIE
jgi:hypothetical protein